MVANNPCPDFELAPLQCVDRAFLKNVPLDEKKVVGSFFALAAAFNDIKGLLWFVEQLEKGKDPTPSSNAYNGQWSGMSLQVKRLLISCFYEVLEMIRVNRDVLDHPKFKDAIKNAGPSATKHWEILVSIDDGRAKRSDLESRIVGLVKKIRNDISFHYYEPDNFLKGYNQWLAASGAGTEKAYFSLGKNAEETRFYIADAVVQKYFEQIFKDQGLSEDEVFKFIKSVNHSLRFILEEFVKFYETPVESCS